MTYLKGLKEMNSKNYLVQLSAMARKYGCEFYRSSDVQDFELIAQHL